MLPISKRDARIEAARKAFPVGAKVIYRPIMGEPEQEETRVRSEPWMLGHGAIVLKIDSRAGGVSVDHLTLVGEVTE